jgi:phage N-6-adenine-methyltransferase
MTAIRLVDTGIPREATRIGLAFLRLHREADAVPPMTPDEYDAFLVDVDTRGITTPLTVTPDGTVLDGRHRFGAAVTLGIEYVPIFVADIEPESQVDYMVRQAVMRRHLTVAERKALAATLLRDAPEKSDRQVAATVGLSDKTVGTVRDELTATADIPQLTSRVGADGRTRPVPWNPGAGLMSSETPEWYTPRHVVAAVAKALGTIDLDPCAEPARAVPAATHYIEADDGLGREWSGRVYMNPPYGRSIGDWTGKLRDEHAAGRVSEAIALLPARTETDWWASLDAEWVCFIHGRLSFSDGDTAAPFPSAAVYLGSDGAVFAETFAELGPVYRRVR